MLFFLFSAQVVYRNDFKKTHFSNKGVLKKSALSNEVTKNIPNVQYSKT